MMSGSISLWIDRPRAPGDRLVVRMAHGPGQNGERDRRRLPLKNSVDADGKGGRQLRSISFLGAPKLAVADRIGSSLRQCLRLAGANTGAKRTGNALSSGCRLLNADQSSAPAWSARL